ncbi:hypothetical protein SLE2022_259280 [Rubroshorea leprosula]
MSGTASMINSGHKKKKKTRKNTSQGPGLFSGFGKAAQGVLTKGYKQDWLFCISTPRYDRWNYTSTALKHESGSIMGVTATYEYDDNTTIHINLDTKSLISTTSTFGIKFPPFTNVTGSLSLPDYNSSKLKIQSQRFSSNSALAMSLSLDQSPAVKLSATVGSPSLAFGAETKYNISTDSFTKFNAGISMMKPDCNASIILADFCDHPRASYMQYFDPSRKTAAVVEIGRKFSESKNTFTVGVSRIVDNVKVKARLDNEGKLGTLLQYKFKPKSYLRICGEFDTIAPPRIGLAVVLKLPQDSD